MTLLISLVARRLGASLRNIESVAGFDGFASLSRAKSAPLYASCELAYRHASGKAALGQKKVEQRSRAPPFHFCVKQHQALLCRSYLRECDIGVVLACAVVRNKVSFDKHVLTVVGTPRLEGAARTVFCASRLRRHLHLIDNL